MSIDHFAVKKSISSHGGGITQPKLRKPIIVDSSLEKDNVPHFKSTAHMDSVPGGKMRKPLISNLVLTDKNCPPSTSGDDIDCLLETDNACPCLRPRSRIYCSNCGYVGTGRLREQCPVHVKVFFVNDYSECPICRTDNLNDF